MCLKLVLQVLQIFQNQINHFQVQMLTFDAQQKIIQTLLKRPQNATCSDCNGKYPCWASLDFGVFICMDCSGAHRALGQSVTRVKSIKLDVWHQNWITNMKIGNTILNQYWEATIDPTQKITPSASIEDRKHFVVQKYVKKKFAQANKDDPLKQFKQKGVIPKSIDKNTNSDKKPRSQSIKKIPQFNRKPQTPTISFKDFGQISVTTKTIKNSNKNKIQDLIELQTTHNKIKKQSVKKANAFDQFNFFEIGQPAKKQKIDRTNYNSFSGINASHSKTGNFDFNQLIQKNNNKMFFNQPKKTNLEKKFENFHTGNFNCFNPKGATDTQYNKNQFTTISPESLNQMAGKIPINLISMNQPNNTHVTMNINMNMYPNVTNINFLGNQDCQMNQISKPIINNRVPIDPSNVSCNPIVASQVPFLNVVQHKQKNEITLQIKDLSKDKQEQTKSWVDQWK